MLRRNKNSHKGQNGKVLVIAGNEHFHGAPILASLGAEYTGVDLVFPILPPCHAQVARTYSCNFILDTFEETHLTKKDIPKIIDASSKVDAVVIGPGLGEEEETEGAIRELLAELKVPTVVDADALIQTTTLPEKCVLTPHGGEFRGLTGEEASAESAQKWAESWKAVVVVKGYDDIIADADNVAINDSGNPLMTVGGSGDVLAGVIGGLIAQGVSPFEAGKLGTRLVGLAGDNLGATRGSIRAIDIAHELPILLHHLYDS